jgi:hypothetical protein
VDRPEFLFGVDMNNNGWIDRFENDELPDYPYKKDHRGYNIYFGTHLSPEIRITLGALREDLISSDQKNQSRYALFTLDHDMATWGHWRLFNMLKSVEDDIPDDLLQWLPNANIRTGESTKIEDPLIGRDTWINSLWLGNDYKLSGFEVSNYLKYDFYHQRLSQNERSPLGLRERDFFFGLINKASYRLDLGRLWIEPRWKSEFRYQSIDLTSTDKRRELTELGGLILGFPLLTHTSVQAGLEFSRFDDFENDINDFNGVVSAVQFSNDSAYLGYQLTTRMGLQIDRRKAKGKSASIITQSFLTVYAGIQ